METQSLPDMALGPANATVPNHRYASMTCPHCAAFTETVFPKIKSEFIDGQDPLRVPRIPARHQAAAGSMLARACQDSPEIFRRHDAVQQRAMGDENTPER